jgi:hypothetical protein
MPVKSDRNHPVPALQYGGRKIPKTRLLNHIGNRLSQAILLHLLIQFINDFCFFNCSSKKFPCSHTNTTNERTTNTISVSFISLQFSTRFSTKRFCNPCGTSKNNKIYFWFHFFFCVCCIIVCTVPGKTNRVAITMYEPAEHEYWIYKTKVSTSRPKAMEPATTVRTVLAPTSLSLLRLLEKLSTNLSDTANGTIIAERMTAPDAPPQGRQMFSDKVKSFYFYMSITITTVWVVAIIIIFLLRFYKK